MDFSSETKMRTTPAFPPYDCGDEHELYIYKNSTKDEFCDFLISLKSSGYTLLQQNENYENSFAILKKENIISVYFTPADNTTRVIYGKNCPVPCLTPTDCNGENGTAFYCFENDHTLIDCGMCLLVQCPDYSFFVVDSGHYFQMNDNDRLYDFMRSRTPENKKIVINGWFITHTHTDHTSKLFDFLKYNCRDAIIEGFYINQLSPDYKIEDWGHEEQVFDRKTREILGNFKSVPVYKLHSGERFYIRNLTFDVMCTHEDVYPTQIEDFNDSSTVLMLTTENTKIFIPGDASSLSDAVLTERFKKKLKCDIVQIAHHGHFGLSTKAYELLEAPVAVFPVTRIKFDEEFKRIEANRKAVEIADEYFISSDGTVRITLPYVKGSATQLHDETFEDFEKIKRLWGYDYTEEYKTELYELFCTNGGDLDNSYLPVDMHGAFLD